MMDYKVIRSNQDELNHSGILGQKWGIRRYQNEDGTLTDAGAKRYASDKRVEKMAAKDAKRYVDAKMFYGKTAGTKRKLLKAELDKKIAAIKLDISYFEPFANGSMKSETDVEEFRQFSQALIAEYSARIQKLESKKKEELKGGFSM